MSKALAKVFWLRKLLSNLDFDKLKLIKLYFNYQGAIASSINPKFHAKSKYIFTYNIISLKKGEMK